MCFHWQPQTIHVYNLNVFVSPLQKLKSRKLKPTRVKNNDFLESIINKKISKVSKIFGEMRSGDVFVIELLVYIYWHYLNIFLIQFKPDIGEI